jgi:hypothetical protein
MLSVQIDYEKLIAEGTDNEARTRALRRMGLVRRQFRPLPDLSSAQAAARPVLARIGCDPGHALRDRRLGRDRVIAERKPPAQGDCGRMYGTEGCE